MYITGDHSTLLDRIWSLPSGTIDVDNFRLEAQTNLLSGNLTSGHRGQIDSFLRLKRFQFDLNPTGLSIPQV